MKLSQKLAALASTAMLLSNLLASGIAGADSATATLAAGTLGAQALPGSITLSGTASASNSSTGMTGTLTGITITDNRGSAAGWDAKSMVNQTFNLAGANVKKYISGSGTITGGITGEYTGGICQGTGTSQTTWGAALTVPCGAIYVKATTVAINLPTVVSIWAPNVSYTSDSATTTGVSLTGNALTTAQLYGLAFTFTGTWATNDYVRIAVDYFPTTTYFVGQSSALAPSSGYSMAGMLTSTSAGVAYTEDVARTDIEAPVGTGAGVYSYNLALAQGVHGNALSGAYNSTMTFTLVSK